MRVAAVLAAVVASLTVCTASRAASGPKVLDVRPKEIDELLANPGMGWQTFYQFADEDKNLAGLPSASAYIRFYWRELEPQEGKIDFAKFDGLLAHAHRVGQKLGFRIMIAATDNDIPSGAPDWLRANGCKGYEYKYAGKGRTYWVPDFDDPVFKEAHFRLVRELGKRYDGHPDVDYVDIGSVGLWGEWHMSDTGVDMPPAETCREIIDAYLEAFPDTIKLMLIGAAERMKYGVSKGAGWRADCLGDCSVDWNHMEDYYPEAVTQANALTAWVDAPVAWETCWDMNHWVKEGWDVHAIFDYALEYHASYVNNKSTPIPDGYRPEVERLLRKLGYRLVLRSLTIPAEIDRDDSCFVSMVWENLGVAPPYRDYRVALRLTDSTGRSSLIATNQSIKGWLPGSFTVAVTVETPKDLATGTARLAIGIIDPRTKQPAVKLAIEGRDGDGWYPLGTVDVK